VALDQPANLLGALSLLITDRMADAMAEAGGRPESGAAALCALLHFLDRPSVDRLRQVLGLTSSGTVRLVDRLAAMGYVRRGAGADGRSTAVELTVLGQNAATGVAGARASVLDDALAALPAAEREDFGRLAGKVLASLIRPPGATRWICRLCDTGTCRGAEGGCPVGNAARERFPGEPAGSASGPGGARGSGGASGSSGPAGGAAEPRP
jgi:DNA-binding MarR family transcriptional regulator